MPAGGVLTGFEEKSRKQQGAGRIGPSSVEPQKQQHRVVALAAAHLRYRTRIGLPYLNLLLLVLPPFSGNLAF